MHDPDCNQRQNRLHPEPILENVHNRSRLVLLTAFRDINGLLEPGRSPGLTVYYWPYEWRLGTALQLLDLHLRPSDRGCARSTVLRLHLRQRVPKEVDSLI